MTVLVSEVLSLISDLKTWYMPPNPQTQVTTPMHGKPHLKIIASKERVHANNTSGSVVKNNEGKKERHTPLDKPLHDIDPAQDHEQEEVSKSPIELWAQNQFTIQQPITPIVCIGDHPLLHKLCQALSDHVAPAVCLQTLPPLSHPLLKALLIPLPALLQRPELAKKNPPWAIHVWQKPILPMHPIEVYVDDPKAKKELWNILLRLSF